MTSLSEATLLVCCIILTIRITFACTALAIAPEAMTDQCAYTTSTSDCKDCDFRLAYVPAKTHPPGAKRPIYLTRFSYPHVVSDRARTWNRGNLQGSRLQLANWTDSVPMGYVPELLSTFALYETGSGYALINEHQVSMGESTCPAVFLSKPLNDGGKALFDVAELSRIALERASTARGAIQVMGDHATKYGYYGAEWDTESKYDEAGETLTVADAAEAWVFHILPDNTGSSAIWAAQRLQPGHVTVVANYFIIREVDTNDVSNFMFSSNMHKIARDEGIWNPKSDTEMLDFSAVFGRLRNHSSYTTLRRWRVLTLADPALGAVLNATTETDLPPGYPFSVRAASTLSPADIKRIQRDHFELTPYDLTKGPAAEPYGDPDRYDTAPNGAMSSQRVSSGEFARGISLFRTSYASVSRSCAHLPRAVGALLLFSQHQPDTSTFLPLYVSAGIVAKPLTRGSLFRFDSDAFFWRAALVSNWAHRYYKYAIPVVRRLQKKLENAAHVSTVDMKATALIRSGQGDRAIELLRHTSVSATQRAHEAYEHFFYILVARLHDGFEMRNPDSSIVQMNSFFYPESWLSRVGFFEKQETSVEKGEQAMQQARKLHPTGMVKYLNLHRYATQKASTHLHGLPHLLFGVLIGVSLCLAVFYIRCGRAVVRCEYQLIKENADIRNSMK